MKKLYYLLTAILVFGFSTISVVKVVVGASHPDNSAQLDIVSYDNRGVLFPRVAFSSAMHYIPPGFYYWDGIEWQIYMNPDDPNILEI